MALILDVTDERETARAVARSWVDNGLLAQLLWVWPDEDGGYRWDLLSSPDRGDPISLNAAVNQLRRKTSVEIVAVVPSHASDWSSVTSTIRDFRDRMDRDFGADGNVPFAVVIQPTHEVGADEDVIGRQQIDAMGGVDIAFLASAEASPAPDLGNELLGSPVRAVLHVITLLTKCWAGGEHATDGITRLSDRPSDGVHLVRGWSRVVDVGFLEDHVASALSSVGVSSNRPREERLRTACDDLWRRDGVANGLPRPELSAREPLPTGWAYIVGFVGFALRRFVRTFAAVVLDRLLAPLIRAIRHVISRIARFLGSEEREHPSGPDGDLTDPDQPSLLGQAANRARDELDALDRGQEVGTPEGAGRFWIPLVNGLFDQLDDGRITVVEALGPLPDSTPCLLARVDERLQDHEGVLRSEIADTSRRDPDDDDDAGVRRDAPQIGRRLKWLTRTAALVALVAGFLWFGPLSLLAIPIVAVSFVTGCLVALLGVLIETLDRLVAAFKREVSPPHTDEQLAAHLDALTVAAVIVGYRRSQLDAWHGALKRTLEMMAAADADVDELSAQFLPSGMPASMQLATAQVDARAVDELARGIRTTPYGARVYSEVWGLVTAELPHVYDVRSRRGAGEDLGRLASRAISDPSSRARGHARGVVRRFLSSPDEHDRHALRRHIASVVRWEASFDRFRGVTYQPPEGLDALGPSGRAVGSEHREAFEHAVEVAEQLSSTWIRRTVDGHERVVVLRASAHGRAGVAPAALENTIEGLATIATDAGGLLLVEGDIGRVDRLPVGTIADVFAGRAVVVAEHHEDRLADGQWPVFTVATIDRVDGAHDLRLDQGGMLGSPVVDVASQRLVGIVTDTAGGLAAGPLSVRRALDLLVETERSTAGASAGGIRRDGADEPLEDDDHLDTGLFVPRDVLTAPFGIGTSHTSHEPPPTGLAATAWRTEHYEEFVAPMHLPGDRAFNPVIGAPRAAHTIATREHAPDQFWTLPSGRTLATAHRLEISEPFSFDDLFRNLDGLARDDADTARPRNPDARL